MPHALLQTGKMDWGFLLIWHVVSWPSLSALFTVEVESPSYQAEFRGVVTMSCRFQSVGMKDLVSGSQDSKPRGNLSVIWHRIDLPTVPANTVEVFRLERGEEKLALQDPQYRGRVKLLTGDLERGLARLQMTQIRINDSGTYQCLVLLENHGADYKQMVLSVKAPYQKVMKALQNSKEEDELELTCQSQGYPLTSVTWTDGNLRKLPTNITSLETADQVFQVTSRIWVRSSDVNNYTCAFDDGSVSAIFHVPDEIPVHVKNNTAIIATVLILTVVLIVAAGFCCIKQRGKILKGTPNTWNLVDPERDPVNASASSSEMASQQIAGIEFQRNNPTGRRPKQWEKDPSSNSVVLLDPTSGLEPLKSSRAT